VFGRAQTAFVQIKPLPLEVEVFENKCSAVISTSLRAKRLRAGFTMLTFVAEALDVQSLWV